MSDLEMIGSRRPWNTFDTVALAAVAISSLAWFGLCLLLFSIGFESSEYEKSAYRWWQDQLACYPVWLAFIGFSAAATVLIFYRKTGLAFCVAMASAISFCVLFA